jgi:hypothetical protein
MFRVLRGFAQTNPKWAPWIMPVLVAYFVFVVMSWLAQPLFNLLLRLNRYGRHALSDDQRRGANLVGLLALPALLCLVWWLATRGNATMGFVGVAYFGLLLLPASAIFKCDAGWPRSCMAAYTVGIGVLMPFGFVMYAFNHQLFTLCIQGHLLGCLLSGWVANALLMQRAKRHTALR